MEIYAAGLAPEPGHPQQDVRPEQVRLCREWLRLFCEPAKKINKRIGSSYALKHEVEHWLASTKPSFTTTDPWGRAFIGHYVSNGAFIKAAVAEGYQLVPQRGVMGSATNAYFNIKMKKKK